MVANLGLTMLITVIMSLSRTTDSRTLQFNNINAPSSTPYETSLELPARASSSSEAKSGYEISPVPRDSITMPAASFSTPYRQIPSPPTSTTSMDAEYSINEPQQAFVFL